MFEILKFHFSFQIKLACPCICKDNEDTYTTEEWREILLPKLDEMKARLSLNLSALSRTIRKRTSASDDRVSSKGLGIVGVIIILIVITFIILSDISTVIHRDGSRGGGAPSAHPP